METEIDLFKYIRILLRRWYLIIGTGILFGVIAFVVTNRPTVPIYRATALVGTTRTYLDLQLAEDFRTVNQAQNVTRAYPDLATSDEVLQKLTEFVSEASGETYTLFAVRGMASAELGEDTSLLKLHITSADPKLARLMVNEWATIFVSQAERVYGVQVDSTTTQLQQQLESAAANLQATEAAIIASRDGDQVTTLSNQLTIATSAHASVLRDQEAVASVLADARRLQTEMATTSRSQPGNANDQVTLLLLQMKAYGLDSSTPLALQISSSATTTETTVGEQLADVAGLIATLEQQQLELVEQLTVLETTINDLQIAYEVARFKQEGLLRQQKVAEEAYLAMSRKVSEIALSDPDSASNVRVASRASLPQFPLGQGSRQTLIMLGAVMAGMLFASVIIIAVAVYQEYSVT